MQIIPNSVDILDTDSLHLHKFSAHNPAHQHGKHRSDAVDIASDGAPLLAIPSESLTHITAFLDPASLFALGRTNKILHEHVGDDNTWHRAFACQFLEERPERFDLQQSHGILLRRCEDTWKREFVLRCNLIRRWERCRNGTVSHMPHYSPIAAMYLLSDRSYGPALLSVSLQYGVVARSFPLSGKVLKGFISASDGFGIGNGNPNAEFTPNISACALTTEGWTVRVAFGFANGEVALASAQRVMESGRTANRVTRCRVDEQHRGPVADVVWDGMYFVTAGVDGEVHVWDAKRLRCIYVLQDQRSMIPDPCIQVLVNLDRGIVLATKQSGTVVVWVGLSMKMLDERSETGAILHSHLTINVPPPATVTDNSNLKEPTDVFLDSSAPLNELCYGIRYKDDMHFYRVSLDLISGQREMTRFGDGPLASIQTICPFFASDKDNEGGRSVISAGDALGRVSLFDWSAKPEPGKDEVSSFRRVDITTDGVGISAIACNAYILAVGTARGVTKIFDTLTLRPLREFASPVPRPNTATTPVKEIIVEKDLVIVAVGERVLAWEAKPVRPHKQMLVVKKAAGKGRGAKWHKRIELAQDINESRKAVEDMQRYERKSHERRRAHQAALEGLGLDENEALQYVLMISRDEAALRRQSQARNVIQDVGGDAETVKDDEMFEADFEDMEVREVDTPSTEMSGESSGSQNVRWTASDRSSLGSRTRVDREISPHLPPQPMEVGSNSVNRMNRAVAIPSPPLLEDPDHFPAISSSSSVSRSVPGPSPSGPSTSWSAKIKVSSSSASASTSSLPSASASVTPFSVSAATNLGSMRRSVSGPPSPSSGPSLLSETLRLYGRGQGAASCSSGTSRSDVRGEEDQNEEVDANLKLALELSLAEALSLKEN